MAGKKLPTDGLLRFFLCEIVREEGNGKISLLGFYVNSEIKILVPLPTQIQLGFVYAAYDGEGTFDIEMAADIPNGPPLPRQRIGILDKKPGIVAALTVNLPLFPINAVGRNTVTLWLDGQPYLRQFDVMI